MRAGLLARLQRLELAATPVPQVCLQYGWLRKLPRDYQGERHIEIVKRLSIQDGLEWVEAEEVPGPPNTVRAAKAARRRRGRSLAGEGRNSLLRVGAVGSVGRAGAAKGLERWGPH